MLKILHLLVFLALPSFQAFGQAQVKHVFVVSIDGGKPSAIEKADMPVLHRLVKEGAHSWQAETIVPSLTLPSHGSMVSGVDMSRHGLSWNDYRPRNGLIKVTTMFALAKEAGISTALIAGKEKFKHLNLPGSIDTFLALPKKDVEIAEVAADYIKAAKPGLMLVHFPNVDGAGHRFGWDTPEYLEALKVADNSLGLIRKAIEEAGIAGDSLLIVTADHGGSGKTHGSGRPAHRNIPWILWGKNVKSGVTLTFPISTMDTPATALWALGVSVPPHWQGEPVTSALHGSGR